MTERKFTDEEIIKALDTPYNRKWVIADAPNKNRDFIRIGDVIDLINRQKAENEKLCIEIDELIIAKDLLFDEAEALIKKAKAEAIKEFAERLKEKFNALEWKANTNRKTLPLAEVEAHVDWILHVTSNKVIDIIVDEFIGVSDE